MNWTNPFARKPKASPAPVVEPIAPTQKQLVAAHIIGLEPWSFTQGVSGCKNDEERYEAAKIEWRGIVYACEDVRATTLALCKFELVDKAGEAVENHALYELLARPNNYQSEYELRKNTQVMLDQYGNAFWYVEKQGGKPIALYPIAPQYMRAVTGGKIPAITQWVNETPNVAPKAYDASEIIHFKHPNPYNSIYGASVIMRAAMEVDQDVLMKMASLGLLQNKSIPPIVLKAQANTGITQETMELMLDKWNAKYRGASNTGFVAGVAEGVEVEVLTGIDITQLLYLEGREFGRKEICAIFRTPEAMLGYVSDANRANMTALEYIFKTQTVKPLARQFCDTIEARLLPMFGDKGLTCELDLEIPRDDVQHLAEMTAGFERNWFNADECRAELGYTPKTDGTGEQYFISAALIPVELAINPPEPEPYLMPGAEEEEPKPEEDAANEDNKAVTDAEAEVSKGDNTKIYHPRSLFKTDISRAARATATDALSQAWIEAYHAKLEKYLSGQKKRVLAAIRETFKSVISKEVNPFDQILEGILAEEDEKFAEVMKPTVTRLMIAFGTAAVHDLKPGASYRIGRMRQYVADDLIHRSQIINKTTAQELRALIQQAFDEGDINATGLGRRISEYYTNMPEGRANTIARTEVHRSQSLAKHDGWLQMGAVAREWIVFPGNRGEGEGDSVGVEVHAFIDGNPDMAVARMGEPYDLNGFVTMGPGLSGDPSMDCNCRCDEAPITDDEYVPPTEEELDAYREEIGE